MANRKRDIKRLLLRLDGNVLWLGLLEQPSKEMLKKGLRVALRLAVYLIEQI